MSLPTTGGYYGSGNYDAGYSSDNSSSSSDDSGNSDASSGDSDDSGGMDPSDTPAVGTLPDYDSDSDDSSSDPAPAPDPPDPSNGSSSSSSDSGTSNPPSSDENNTALPGPGGADADPPDPSSGSSSSSSDSGGSIGDEINVPHIPNGEPNPLSGEENNTALPGPGGADADPPESTDNSDGGMDPSDTPAVGTLPEFDPPDSSGGGSGSGSGGLDPSDTPAVGTLPDWSPTPNQPTVPQPVRELISSLRSRLAQLRNQESGGVSLPLVGAISAGVVAVIVAIAAVVASGGES